MLNRRFLRTKVFQALYAYYQDGKDGITSHEKFMSTSPEKAYQLYFFLLAFPNEFKFFLKKELDIQTTKHFPDKEFIGELSLLLKNKVITRIEQDVEVREQIKKDQIRWTETTDLFKNLLTEIRKSSFYTEYIKNQAHTFLDDRKFVLDIYEFLFSESELFETYVEDRFINWEDDQLAVFLAITRAIRKMKETPGGHLMEKFVIKNDEDQQFMHELFRQTINHEDDLVKLIGDKTNNWETERIAIVDLLLMKMALCEILYFSQIPVKVTINEYLELAKHYSTPSSHGFINGVLDKIQLELKEQNKIHKTGRGLVE